MGVKVAVAQAAMNTSTGDQDITVSGFGTVKAYLAFVGLGITDGTAIDDANWCVGGADGTTQSLASFRSDHGGGDSDAYRNMETDEVLQIMDGDGEVDGEANHDSFVTDGIRINVGDAPATATLMKFVFFGGSDLSVHVGTGTITANKDSDTSFTGTGFEPDIIFFWTTTSGTGPPGDASSNCSFGFARTDP